ncbi:MAG: lipase family protein [Terriglobia bacterium]
MSNSPAIQPFAPSPAFVPGFNREIADMLAEFANDVYGPLQYTADDVVDESDEGIIGSISTWFKKQASKTATATIPEIRKKQAVDVLKSHAHNVVQRERSQLAGYKGIHTVVCQSGVMSTEEYFGCILYSRSEFDVMVKCLLRLLMPSALKSIVNYTHLKTVSEIKEDISNFYVPEALPKIYSDLDSASKERRVVIAFRGTKKLKDWMTNLHGTQSKIPFYPGDAHSGFLNMYMSGRDGVLATVDRLIPKDPALKAETLFLITGHSLGGALATLCVADLLRSKQLNPPPVCYTFAAPRVGDKHFADVFKVEIARRYNPRLNSICSVRAYRSKDIVPKVPPAGLFKHVANKWSFGTVRDSSGAGGSLGGAPHGMSKYRELVQNPDPDDDE